MNGFNKILKKLITVESMYAENIAAMGLSCRCSLIIAAISLFGA